MEWKFNIQLFADTDLPLELVQEGWARDCWDVGYNKAFFKKFTGNSSEYIIDVEEDLKKEDGDTFSASLIGKAKRLATADKNTMVQPIRIDGKDTYVMVIDQWQARDLIADPIWREAQQYANIRGQDNPIFSGSLGMYNGVVIHQHPNVLRTATGSSGTKVGHALFLGAQAAVFAVGGNPEWNEERDDYNNQTGFSFGRIFGIKKSQFKFDNVNWTDFGVVNVMTASEDD